MTHLRDYVGIDVGKHRLDVSFGAVSFSVSNDGAGHQQLVERLSGGRVAAIGLEASGGYERAARTALRQAGLPVRLIDSWRLRQFAKGYGRYAKTDRLDAAMIARFTEVVPPEAEVERDPACEELERLVSYREPLIAETVRLSNQIAQLDDDWLIAMSRRRLEVARDSLKELNARIRAVVRGDKTLKRKAAILESAPGIGFVNAITLLAKVPELGQRSPKKIAALVGLAPYDDKSGSRDKGAHIKRGRPLPRAKLCLAALSLLRNKPWAQAFRDKLTAKGKPKMVAVVALMRRLLVALNAMIKEDRFWREPAT